MCIQTASTPPTYRKDDGHLAQRAHEFELAQRVVHNRVGRLELGDNVWQEIRGSHGRTGTLFWEQTKNNDKLGTAKHV